MDLNKGDATNTKAAKASAGVRFLVTPTGIEPVFQP
jgi:hypothetical protein